MRKAKKIKIPKLSENLAYLCGILAGDGYIQIREHKKEYLVNCGGNPKDEKEFYNRTIKNLFKELFNISVKPQLFSKGTYGVNVYSKNLVEFLLNEIGLTKSPKNSLRIPKIFYSDRKLLFKFIKGVADTDFSIVLRYGKYPVISGSSKCKEFMREISLILEENWFKVNRFFDVRFNDNRFKKGFSIINRIEMNGHHQLIKWLDVIGTNQPKNLEKIRIWKEKNKDNKRIKW